MDEPVERPKKKQKTNTSLKPNHQHLPIWVTVDGDIFLEAFSPWYERVIDFIVAIAEPVYRAHLIHEYKINKLSLFAAVSIGLTGDMITAHLQKISKNIVPEKLLVKIQKSANRYGKAKLVIHKEGYRIESNIKEILTSLLEDEIIKKSLDSSESNVQHNLSQCSSYLDKDVEKLLEFEALDEESERIPQIQQQEDRIIEDTDGTLVSGFYSFAVTSPSIEIIKRRCIELDYPLLEEYDFRRDSRNPSIRIELKPSTSIRPYQEKCLSKMFSNGRARSGIIALPCGAGKTLVGVTAATTIKKPVIVLCTSGVAVEQWKQQFKLWTTVTENQIFLLIASTKKDKKRLTERPDIVITTYNMLSHKGKRSKESQQAISVIKSVEWGLMILDEVHVVPANTFRKALDPIRAHTKLGLTATLVREDEMIQDLNFLIGPKLYEANWIDLINQGFIANIQCLEVLCEMPKEFQAQYSQNPKAAPSRLLYVMNPNKIRTCEFLIKDFEKKGCKILVFSDNVFALKYYADKFKRPYVYGGTPNAERIKIFSQFQHDVSTKTLFISKIGDNSIDLPEANVIIQISSHFGSRRQEAQRLGRILRPKSKSSSLKGEFEGFFYSLVSEDTQEMEFSRKRQQFLIDQGYSFKMMESKSLVKNDDESLILGSVVEQGLLLKQLGSLGAKESQIEVIVDELDEVEEFVPQVRRNQVDLQGLSGGDQLIYREYNNDEDPMNED